MNQSLKQKRFILSIHKLNFNFQPPLLMFSISLVEYLLISYLSQTRCIKSKSSKYQ